MKKVHEKTTHISGGNLVNDHLALGVTSSKVLTVGRVGKGDDLERKTDAFFNFVFLFEKFVGAVAHLSTVSRELLLVAEGV